MLQIVVLRGTRVSLGDSEVQSIAPVVALCSEAEEPAFHRGEQSLVSATEEVPHGLEG